MTEHHEFGDFDADEVIADLLSHPDPFDTGWIPPPGVVEVMTPDRRRQLYRTPHVHDPDGRCVRNRYHEPCDAVYDPDTPNDQR